MDKILKTDIQSFILSFIKERMKSSGRSFNIEVKDDFDLFLEGVLDSLGVLDLMNEVGTHFGKEIDFESIDPEEMTVIGPLCSHIEQQLNNRD